MRAFALSLAIVVLPSCSDDPPADVAGQYAIDVTTDSDDCSLDSFTDGTASVTLTQDVDDASILSADFGGVIAPFLGLDLGGTEFNGTISGGTISATLTGAQRTTPNLCTWHVLADLDANVNGDAITGTITYTGKINFETDDCPFVDDCSSSQSFDGSR